MSKFDDRVAHLVDEKLDDVRKLFSDVPENFPNLEDELAPVMDKLRKMHNLLADIKQEIRRVEKNSPDKREPPDAETPQERLPEGIDYNTLTLEDLRQYLPPDTEIGPYDPSAGVKESLRNAFRKRFRNVRIPGLSPDYMDEVFDGFEDLDYTPFLTPKEIWYLINHPDKVNPLTWRDTFYLLFHPQEIAPMMSEKLNKVKQDIHQSMAQEQSNTNNIVNEVNNSTTVITDDIASAVDTAEDLTQTILTELTTCCATTSSKLDVIRRLIEEGGGTVVKQDTLLVRKKMAEIDGLLEDLRRELRQFSEIRADSERWFEEKRREP